MSELAEVCLDGEVSQTCPPDFAEWLPLKLWFLDAIIFLEFLVRSHPAPDYPHLTPFLSGRRFLASGSGPMWVVDPVGRLSLLSLGAGDLHMIVSPLHPPHRDSEDHGPGRAFRHTPAPLEPSGQPGLTRLRSSIIIYCRQAALRRATKLLMPTPQGRRPLPIPSGREGYQMGLRDTVIEQPRGDPVIKHCKGL